ncbi:ribonuclease H-like domain-containing protein [Anaerococcus sp. AGMB00486]|uniref:Ribonuclease H-like domain-containing protein n=2 Tax=Anaerococcus TaxID=165779 RepID=A0ABX2N7F6_9FIRM|nr:MULTISPECIES: ribonuclease H-like domain-containing protein [Anaerococcus]MDY3005462.1 ribonuclease H-like domain-containing protein [Anaerococcus porci]MSS76890.1 hypothetical protein [Anaerococcus porci]NVF10626.1 ribonuclease H-like domain-containing protein [Anaerococcus faecalis]
MLNVRYRYKKKNIDKDELILDIETTGLNAQFENLVVLGLIYFDNKRNDFYIDQYFAKTDKEEIKLLKIYLKKVKNKKVITYNGDIFDIPFLNIRLEYHNLNPIWPNCLDLYKLIKSKRKFLSLDSMKLMDMEKRIGIFRNDPSRYKVISKLNNDLKSRNKPWPILIHNKNDLIATESLANIGEIINKKLSININDYIIYIDNANIDNNVAKIILRSNKTFLNSYFSSSNYILKTNYKKIELDLLVLYGNISKNAQGFVTINNFNIENKNSYKIDKNLITIMEDGVYNIANILNIVKSLIIENLEL